jgi:hypothetical protein
MLFPFGTLAFVLIVITGLIILIFRDWRINASALTVQFLAVFMLVTLSWPIGLSIIKLIVGWMATAAIALTCLRQMETQSSSEPASSLFFRGLIGLLAILLIFVVAPTVREAVFPQVELVIIQGGLMLIGMALMQLGTNSEPYLTIMSLLSLLAGFEVIHAALEISTLLTGLLVVVNLGLALVGVYFIVKTNENQEKNKTEDKL